MTEWEITARPRGTSGLEVYTLDDDGLEELVDEAIIELYAQGKLIVSIEEADPDDRSRRR